MTNIEQELKRAAESCNCSLMKYYNNGETRDPNIPDILDAIDDEIAELQTIINKLTAKILNACHGKSTTYVPSTKRLNERKDELSMLDELYNKIADDPYEYYFVDMYAGTAFPVLTKTMSVQKPVIIDNKLTFADIHNTRDVYYCEDPNGNRKFPLIPCNTAQDNIIYLDFSVGYSDFVFHTEKLYVGFENWLQNHPALNQSEFYVCKENNCDNIFSIDSRERQWYALRGLNIPKRCPHCRQERKSAKFLDNLLDLI